MTDEGADMELVALSTLLHQGEAGGRRQLVRDYQAARRLVLLRDGLPVGFVSVVFHAFDEGNGP